MCRRDYMFALTAVIAAAMPGVALRMAGAQGNQDYSPASCSVADCTKCIMATGTNPNYCGGQPYCGFFTGGGTVSFNVCVWNSGASSPCVMTPWNANLSCPTGTGWYCSCASVSGGLSWCNEQGCGTCGKPGGFGTKLTVNAKCT